MGIYIDCCMWVWPQSSWRYFPWDCITYHDRWKESPRAFAQEDTSLSQQSSWQSLQEDINTTHCHLIKLYMLLIHRISITLKILSDWLTFNLMLWLALMVVDYSWLILGMRGYRLEGMLLAYPCRCWKVMVIS